MKKTMLNIYKLSILFILSGCAACRPNIENVDFYIDGISTIKKSGDYVGEPNINDPEQVRIASINTEVTFEDKTSPENSVAVRTWLVDDKNMKKNEAIFKHSFDQPGTYHVKLRINEDKEVEKIVYIAGGNPVVVASPEPPHQVDAVQSTKTQSVPSQTRDVTVGSSPPPPLPPPPVAVATQLSINPLNSQLSEAGGNIEITINSNVEWMPPSHTADWIVATKKGNKLTLNCKANSGATERSSYIEISAGDKKENIRIAQAAAKIEPINQKDIKTRGAISLANCNDDGYTQSSSTIEITPKMHIVLKKIYINTSEKGDIRVKIGNKETSIYVNKGKNSIALDDDDIEQILEPNKTYKISFVGEDGIKFSSCSMSDADNAEISIKSNNLSVYNLSYSFKKSK